MTTMTKPRLTRDLTVSNINNNSFINQFSGRRSVEVEVGVIEAEKLNAVGYKKFMTYTLTIPASDLIMGVATPTVVRANRFHNILRDRAEVELALDSNEEVFYIGLRTR